MIDATACIAKYGPADPHSRWLALWDVPEDMEVGVIPRRIYCNKDLVEPLSEAFCNIIQRDLICELKTYDGCYNVRPKRGYESRYKSLMAAGRTEEASLLLSLHTWGVAIDINAFENGLGQEPKMSQALVACFTDAGFDWGGHWKRKDGMHFQLASI